MRHGSSLVLLALTPVLLLAACTADRTGDDACHQFALATCQRLAACTPFRLQQVYGDVATCVASAAPYCSEIFCVPDTGATPAKIDACAAAVPSLTCDELLQALSAPTP